MANEVFNKRRANLRALIRQHEGATSLAKALGYTSPSYVSQMAGPHPTRQITEKVAREIERKLLLPANWLDKEPVHYAGKVQDDKVQQAVLLVGQLLKDSTTTVSPEQFAGLVALAYERGDLDETYIRRLIHLINPDSRHT